MDLLFARWSPNLHIHLRGFGHENVPLAIPSAQMSPATGTFQKEGDFKASSQALGNQNKDCPTTTKEKVDKSKRSRKENPDARH